MSSEREGGEKGKEVSGRGESDANRWGETIALPGDRRLGGLCLLVWGG